MNYGFGLPQTPLCPLDVADQHRIVCVALDRRGQSGQVVRVLAVADDDRHIADKAPVFGAFDRAARGNL